MTSVHDDLSYFPPGPEFKLTKQVQAIEEYKLRQQQTTKPVAESTDHEGEAKPEEEETESIEKSPRDGVR